MYLLIALFTTTGGIQIGAAVVCVGADGHIDVESVFDGCCNPVAADDHGAGVNVVVDGSSCGDCVDVQLRMVPLKTREGWLFSPTISAGLRSMTSSCLSGADGRNSFPPNCSDRQSQSLTLLSTVILLT